MNIKEPFKLIGVVALRQFQYLFPVDDDGKQLEFDDRKAWEEELKDCLRAKVDIFQDVFVLRLTSKLSNSKVNEEVCEITRRHLVNGDRVGGVFWGLIENDNAAIQPLGGWSRRPERPRSRPYNSRIGSRS